MTSKSIGFIALAILFAFSNSFAQHVLQVDDGLSHSSVIKGSTTGGTYTLQDGGGMILTTSVYGTVVSKTAAYTALSTDRFIFASAATAGYTITLPTAANKGQLITVTKTDATTFTITVAAAASESIVQIGSRATLTAQGYSVTLAADGGTKWYVVAHEAADPAVFAAGAQKQQQGH